MKKYLRYADVFVLFSGALGLVLRLILRLGGTDHRGLYPANHPAWIILCIWSILVVACLWLLTRDAGNEQRYRKNFPASLPGAIGSAIGAVGMAVTAFSLFEMKLLPLLCFVLGLLSAAGLLLSALFRYTGKKPHFLCHALPAFFFALRIFQLGQQLGAEPEMNRFLFEMLASLAMIPACYQLWGFDVDLGKREKSLFWSLTAAYLCMVAIVGMDNWLLYLSMAAWLMTNLCPLKRLNKRPRPAAQPDEEEAPAEEEVAPAGDATSATEAAASATENKTVSAETAASAPENDPLAQLDPDAILADILREIDKNVE